MKDKTGKCPACGTQLGMGVSVCTHCGREIESIGVIIFPVDGKKVRIYDGLAHLTERRMVIKANVNSSLSFVGIGVAIVVANGVRGGMDFIECVILGSILGLIVGGISSLILRGSRSKLSNLRELDSLWEDVSEIHIAQEKMGKIAAGCGVYITYASGAQIVLGMSKKQVPQIAQKMEELRRKAVAQKAWRSQGSAVDSD